MRNQRENVEGVLLWFLEYQSRHLDQRTQPDEIFKDSDIRSDPLLLQTLGFPNKEEAFPGKASWGGEGQQRDDIVGHPSAITQDSLSSLFQGPFTIPLLLKHPEERTSTFLVLALGNWFPGLRTHLLSRKSWVRLSNPDHLQKTQAKRL